MPVILFFYFLLLFYFFYLYAYFSDMYIFRHARIVFWLGIVDGKEKKEGGEGGGEGAEVCSWAMRMLCCCLSSLLLLFSLFKIGNVLCPALA